MTDAKLLEMAREITGHTPRCPASQLCGACRRAIEKLRSVREQTAQRCAGLLCARCSEGDIPQNRIVFNRRWSHVWKKEEGNGHSLCGASEIWDHAREFGLEGK